VCFFNDYLIFIHSKNYNLIIPILLRNSLSPGNAAAVKKYLPFFIYGWGGVGVFGRKWRNNRDGIIIQIEDGI